jgi:peptidoglycan/LPS O-acetylase OafA/YrhL
MPIISVRDPIRKREFSLWLDAFRWISAMIVVVNHSGGVLLVSLSEVPPALRTLPHYAFSFVSGFAHYAVMVFFVMSGYLVGGSFLKGVLARNYSIKQYILRRVIRLSIVLLPTLVLTVILAHAGIAVHPPMGQGPYSPKLVANLSSFTFLCNAVYLQNVACARFGDNHSLWSLTHEFWYYCVFPLFAVGVLGRRPILCRMCLVALGATVIGALTTAQISNAPIALYFGVWLLGVVASIAPKPRVVGTPTQVGAVFISMLVSTRVLLGPTMQFGISFESWVVDFALSCVFCWLLLCLKWSNNLKVPPLPEANSTAAKFSYTLYCVHIPILLFLSSISMRVLGFGYKMIPSSTAQWLLICVIMITTVASAYLFSLVTEARTERVRAFLSRS